ncbi:DUF6209 family protein [Polyangium aurulentum]|uniref:DUF6209 family protein n=1 Tax=Polyangium aurulentum TaxID=2567896 RepID=UPI0010AE85C4|nr:DUF6209 family protein [Polyangium aurulentum]UQA59839.1 hypothetical protein E8A73_004890 [Polyangium aurulentum]
MATVSFSSDWSQQQSGDVRAGESLRIEYATERLCTCRATRYGQKAWGLTANFRFHPSRQEQSLDVSSGACEVNVPADASRIEVWFHNTDNTGCSAWDSRYGQNYSLDVKAAG